ncbi:hypothetical protein GYMLUDRAFT_100076 [Collybiopsis luxurians FD-317 M1]|uniref:Uncharacterized protein n=1 Tax=Collybiopsis luxurians FD-317 M1 TaxID=944289 RepID=A0A0D0C8W0_9AGAR|nr:hypothetical protein GYMLUDRAFT_100076 [Collybiopsis luxurians FD-317 M1]
MSPISESSFGHSAAQTLFEATANFRRYADNQRPSFIRHASETLPYGLNMSKSIKEIGLKSTAAALLEMERDRIVQDFNEAASLCKQTGSLTIQVHLRWIKAAKGSLKQFEKKLDEVSTNLTEWRESHKKYSRKRETPSDNGSDSTLSDLGSPALSHEAGTEFTQLPLYSAEGKSIGSLIDLQLASIAQGTQPEGSIPNNVEVEIVTEIEVQTEGEVLRNTISRPLNPEEMNILVNCSQNNETMA